MARAMEIEIWSYVRTEKKKKTDQRNQRNKKSSRS